MSTRSRRTRPPRFEPHPGPTQLRPVAGSVTAQLHTLLGVHPHVHVVETSTGAGMLPSPASGSGVVRLQGDPGARRSGWMAHDLLCALGVDEDLPDGTRNYRQAEALATVRLVEAAVTDVVVVDAAAMNDECRDDLAGITAVVGARLWLVFDTGTLDRESTQLLGWTSVEHPADAVKDVLTRPGTPPVAPAASARPRLPVGVLPEADWPVLLTEVDRRAPELRDAVRARWQHTTAKVTATLEPVLVAEEAQERAEEVLADVLRDVVDAATTRAELAVDVRAVQAVAFRFGWHVRVELANLRQRRRLSPGPAARTVEQWAQLRCFPHPNRGGIAALSAAGLTPAQTVEVTLGQVDPDGIFVTLDGKRVAVEPGAQPLLRGLVLLRLAEGAQPNDRLLLTSKGTALLPRGVTDGLADIAAVTGLLLSSTGSRLKRTSALYDHGFAISQLGPRLPHAGSPAPTGTGAVQTADPPDGLPEVLLDVDLVRRRRLELRLSHRELARLAGTTMTTLTALDRGVNHRLLSFGVVHDLAAALNVTVGELTHTAPTTLPCPGETDSAANVTADVALLGAMLLDAGRLTASAVLLDALDWSSARLRAAADGLAEQAAVLGMRLVDRDGAQFGLLPVVQVPQASREALARARFAQDGMRTSTARLLHAAVRAHFDGSSVKVEGNDDRVVADELVKAGLLTTDLRVSSLVLDVLFGG